MQQRFPEVPFNEGQLAPLPARPATKLPIAGEGVSGAVSGCQDTHPCGPVWSDMPQAAESRRAGRKFLADEVPPLHLAFVLGCDNPSILIT